MSYHLPVLVYVRSGPNAGEEFRIDLGTTTIGQEAENNISLNDPDISLRHAKFEQAGENYIITDLGSSNGTFVNGKRIKGRQTLKPGDQIRLGGTVLEVRTSFSTQASIPPLPKRVAAPTATKPRRSLLPIFTIVACAVLFLGIGVISGFDRQLLPAPVVTVANIALNLVSNATPTETQIPSPTFTPTETPTFTPTSTPTNTNTPTPTATATPTPRSLKTGTILTDKGIRDGLGELSIDNSRGQDAVIILATSKSETLLSVYVRGGGSFRVTDIRDGTYLLYVTQGEDWDSAAGKFTRKARYYRFDDPLSFVTTEQPGGQEYSTFTFTLYSVPNGNAVTVPLNQSQFPGQK